MTLWQSFLTTLELLFLVGVVGFGSIIGSIVGIFIIVEGNKFYKLLGIMLIFVILTLVTWLASHHPQYFDGSNDGIRIRVQHIN